MTGLHGWITQQIDRVEAVARATRQASLDWEYDDFVHEIRDLGNGGTVAHVHLIGTGAHIALHDPAAVLRRCTADRKILARHRLATEWTWSHDTPCHGCGVMGDCDDPITTNLNDCPELLNLAHAHGITDEIISGLDKPQMPPRPAYKPRGPKPDTSRVPAALRGPNWHPPARRS